MSFLTTLERQVDQRPELGKGRSRCRGSFSRRKFSASARMRAGHLGSSGEADAVATSSGFASGSPIMRPKMHALGPQFGEQVARGDVRKRPYCRSTVWRHTRVRQGGQ